MKEHLRAIISTHKENGTFLFYSCHKNVYALPMNRFDYNEFRGWIVPEDENPDDAGYMVINPSDGEQEHVSWSPKNVFDAGHIEESETPPDYKQRVKFESGELSSKISDLEVFLGTPVSMCVKPYERELLVDQLRFMRKYHEILMLRIKHHKDC